MKRRYYTKESLREALAVYERHYGLTCDEFLAHYRSDDLPEIPRSIAASWAGICEEYEKLASTEADLASRAEERLLALH